MGTNGPETKPTADERRFTQIGVANVERCLACEADSAKRPNKMRSLAEPRSGEIFIAPSAEGATETRPANQHKNATTGG
jgi:hypothetical protein